jgi:hypothetical protein
MIVTSLEASKSGGGLLQALTSTLKNSESNPK